MGLMQFTAWACIFRFVNDLRWAEALVLALFLGVLWGVTQTWAMKRSTERARSRIRT